MRLIYTILILGICNQLTAQLNLAVGLGIGYTQAEVHNQLVYSYNEPFRTGTLKGAPLEDLKYLSGLNLGAKYSFDLVALELNWEKLTSTLESVAEDAAELLVQEQLFYTMNNISLSIESNWGALGFGVAGGYRFFKVEENTANTDTKYSIYTDRQIQKFIKPFLNLNLKGSDYLGVSIKPYVSFNLDALNLDPIAGSLKVNPTNELEDFLLFGVSVGLYNGLQRER